MKVNEIPDHIARQIENFSIPNGDRGDDVAVALRRFYQRVMLCPCMNKSCMQCQFDLDTIVDAWEASQVTV
jgi:hypothetical protein